MRKLMIQTMCIIAVAGILPPSVVVSQPAPDLLALTGR